MTPVALIDNDTSTRVHGPGTANLPRPHAASGRADSPPRAARADRPSRAVRADPARLDVRGLLPAIEAETLVIGCVRDATTPVENSREPHAALRRGTYAEIESGHVVIFERPDELVTLVREFLDRG